jgi:outer membrane biosynthesis protein TonB
VLSLALHGLLALLWWTRPIPPQPRRPPTETRVPVRLGAGGPGQGGIRGEAGGGSRHPEPPTPTTRRRQVRSANRPPARTSTLRNEQPLATPEAAFVGEAPPAGAGDRASLGQGLGAGAGNGGGGGGTEGNGTGVGPAGGRARLRPSEAAALRTHEHFPNLPESLRVPRTTYKTVLQICVDERGAVERTEVHTSSDRRLDEVLEAAARTWRYQPYRIAAAAAPFCHLMTFTYVFD